MFDTVHPVFPEYLLERDVKINHPNGMRVLMVAQDDKLRVLRAGFLGVSGFDVVVPGNTEEAAAAIWTTVLDAMLLSYSIPSRDAVYLAQLFRAIRPHGKLIGNQAQAVRLGYFLNTSPSKCLSTSPRLSGSFTVVNMME